MDDRELTDYDVFLFRRFCADELANYLEPMRDFWEHSASYAEAGPGEHALLDSRYAVSAGYRVEKRKRASGPARGLAAYPFVRVRSLNVVPADGSSKLLLRKALSEPLLVGEFHCVLDSDKRVAFLSDEAYVSTLAESSMEACVVLGREEAYAILAGETLPKTRRRLMRVFGIEEGEWLDASR